MSLTKTYGQYKDTITERFYENVEKVIAEKKNNVKNYSVRGNAMLMGLKENDINTLRAIRPTPSIFTAFIFSKVLDCSVEELMRNIYDIDFKKVQTNVNVKRGRPKKKKEEKKQA